MLLLSAKSYVYNILSLYLEGHGKKSSLNLVSFTGLVYRPPKSVCFFGKCIGKEVLKLFSGINNYPQPPIFGFSNSISYGLEKSRELRRLIS